jgi:GGDEF domain-containing protein
MLTDLVDRLREAVAAPIDVGGLTFELSVTIGTVAVTGADDESADELVAAADVDMYLRKPSSGRPQRAEHQPAPGGSGGR